jgi:hypothetical protein
MGIKVADRAASCPFTGRFLMLSDNDKAMQSRNLCFPILIIMRQETKELYKEFTPTYKRLQALSTRSKKSLLQQPNWQ